MQQSSPRHFNFGKSSSTFGNNVLSSVEPRDKSAAELRHFGEGVGLTALVDYVERGSLLHADGVRLEVPLLVRMPGCGFFEQLIERCGISEGDVLAEVRAEGGVKSGRIALVQRNNLFRNGTGYSRLRQRLIGSGKGDTE